MTILRVVKIRKHHASGFTLIELMVTLVIVGLIMGLVIGQVGKLTSRDMKAASRHLSSMIRYLYNKASSEGVTLRMVFDLDEQSYAVEGTSEHFTLTREEEEAFKKRDHGPGTMDQGLKDKEKSASSEKIQNKEATFSPQESALLKSVKLPKGVFFKDVYAEHQIDKLNHGKAFLYFFPQGYVERSVINLRDEKDEVHYSLSVNPISGSVKIESNYKEAEIER